MKQAYFFARLIQPITRSTSILHGLSIALLMGLLLGSFSACQRASYATFAPSERPDYHTPTTEVAPAPTTPTLTASTADVPDLTVLASDGLMAGAAYAVSSVPLKQAKPQTKNRRTAPPACDQIVLRNGDIVEAKVKEIGVNEIKYKKCDRPDGPDYTIARRDVLSIRYPNGEVERFGAPAASNYSNGSSSSSSSNRPSSYNSPTNSQDDGPRTDPFAIVSLATGALAVLTGYGAFLLGTAAIVFGALSLSRIRKEPNRFKGKGMAIAGMVAGLVSAAFILIYILTP